MEVLCVVYPRNNKREESYTFCCRLIMFNSLPASIGEHVPPTQRVERAGEMKRRAIAGQCAVSADERKGLDPYETAE
jgi:hypothetical protein